VFISVKGLGEDMNKALRQRGVQYHVNEGLGMTYSVLWFAALAIPLPLSVFATVTNRPDIEFWATIVQYSFLLVILPVSIFFYKSVKNGAIALLEQEKQQETATV
jgi:hypothetical protein